MSIPAMFISVGPPFHRHIAETPSGIGRVAAEA